MVSFHFYFLPRDGSKVFLGYIASTPPIRPFRLLCQLSSLFFTGTSVGTNKKRSFWHSFDWLKACSDILVIHLFVTSYFNESFFPFLPWLKFTHFKNSSLKGIINKPKRIQTDFLRKFKNEMQKMWLRKMFNIQRLNAIPKPGTT